MITGRGPAEHVCKSWPGLILGRAQILSAVDANEVLTICRHALERHKRIFDKRDRTPVELMRRPIQGTASATGVFLPTLED